MMREPVYKCENCGWKGVAPNALMEMYPKENEPPRCPKCLTPLKETVEGTEGD